MLTTRKEVAPHIYVKPNDYRPGWFIPEYQDGDARYGGRWFRQTDTGRYVLDNDTTEYTTVEDAAIAGVASYWPELIQEQPTMKLLPKKRKNQAIREVMDTDGVVWRVNRHGVAVRYEPDPHFPGMEIVVTPEPYSKHRELFEFALANDPTFKRCKCC